MSAPNQRREVHRVGDLEGRLVSRRRRQPEHLDSLPPCPDQQCASELGLLSPVALVPDDERWEAAPAVERAETVLKGVQGGVADAALSLGGHRREESVIAADAEEIVAEVFVAVGQVTRRLEEQPPILGDPECRTFELLFVEELANQIVGDARLAATRGDLKQHPLIGARCRARPGSRCAGSRATRLLWQG